ncbi:unnamed protein product [Boreogadus saida]
MGPVAFQRKTLPPKPQSDWQHCANECLTVSPQESPRHLSAQRELNWNQSTAEVRTGPPHGRGKPRAEGTKSGEERGDMREWRTVRRYERVEKSEEI